jgi:hypothetical protein
MESLRSMVANRCNSKPSDSQNMTQFVEGCVVEFAGPYNPPPLVPPAHRCYHAEPMELKIGRMRFEIAERHNIVEQTERGTGKLELLLLKKVNPCRPNYRLAVAYRRQGQIQLRYVCWYLEKQFGFDWTADPSKAIWFSEKQAKRTVKAILESSNMFYDLFLWYEGLQS